MTISYYLSPHTNIKLDVFQHKKFGSNFKKIITY